MTTPRNRPGLSASKRLIYLILGCLMYALGVNLFLDDNGIAAGGLAGIATILEKLFPLRLSLLILLLNIPPIIIALTIKGWSFVKNTLAGFVLYTVLIEITSYLPTMTHDPVLASVLGGVLYGVGMAFVTLANGSIGGTELINRILGGFLPNIGVGGFCIIVDGTIVIMSMIIFQNVEIGLYAIITIFVCAFLSTPITIRISWGSKHGSLCIIITDHPSQVVTELLIQTLGISVTKLEGTGMYTSGKMDVLFAAVHESETIQIKKLLREIGLNYFVMVVPINVLEGGKMN